VDQLLDTLRRLMERIWSPVVDLRDDLRRRRARPADPSTPPPTVDDSDQVTVVASATDDVIAVVERIEAAGASEVILRVPREARAFRDPAAWPHIAAVAKRNGMALGVVTPRRDVRSHARENGLQAAGSTGRVTQAPHHQLSVGERTFYVPRFPLGALIRVAVLAVGIYALVIMSCNTIPSAEIVIVPASEEVTATARVRLNPVADDPDLELGVAPAVTFRHVFEATLVTVTTGEVDVPDERATVLLQFFNPSDTELVVSAGRQVDDENGISFTTDEDVTVPAGSFANVDATAVFAGVISNIASGSLTFTVGLPEGVTVINWSQATGGTDKTVQAVGDDDVDRIQELAKTVLRRIGERALFEAVGDDTVFPQTLSVSIFSQDSLSNLGEPTEVFEVDFTAVATALVITDEQSARYGAELIASELESGFELLPGSTTATVSSARIAGGTLTVLLEATGLVAALVDEVAVSEALSGMSPAEATIQLEQMLAIEGPPTITLRPRFIPWRWLPRKAGRISVTFAGPESLIEDEESEDGEATASSAEDASATATASP
jgi:baseplate J-like protein